MRQVAKKQVDGNWVLTRTDATPDSARDISRDDALFDLLASYFTGNTTQFDLEAIAAAYNTKVTLEEEKVTPAEIFSTIHGYYGYLCLGTGENPVVKERLTEEEKIAREQAMGRALTELRLPHILIKGKYMREIENTYFIPFNDQTIGLPAVLQSDTVRQVAAIATAHNQDSLLICQKGYACYLYTSGPQEGSVIAGKTAVVYPGEKQLPDDCYSLFVSSDIRSIVGFTCGLNFGRVYATIEEYVASENKTLQAQYSDFLTQPLESPPVAHPSKKIVILLRGTDGYNQYAIDLQNQLRKTSGLRVAIFGTDAHIAKINEEVTRDNASDPRGPKADWKWDPQIRNEFIRRNQEIYHALLLRDDIDVVVYADMNKLLEFMQPMITHAQNTGHVVLSHVVNSFVFESGRSDYVKTLCDQYGPYMGRHVTDFNDRVRSQITAPVISTNVIQYHSVPVGKFAEVIAQTLSELKSSTHRDQASAAALTTGSGTFAHQTQQPIPVPAQPSKTVEAAL